MEIVCSTEIASPYLRTFLWISILFIYLHKLPHCTYLNELIMKFALYFLGAEDLSYMLKFAFTFLFAERMQEWPSTRMIDPSHKKSLKLKTRKWDDDDDEN